MIQTEVHSVKQVKSMREGKFHYFLPFVKSSLKCRCV